MDGLTLHNVRVFSSGSMATSGMICPSKKSSCGLMSVSHPRIWTVSIKTSSSASGRMLLLELVELVVSAAAAVVVEEATVEQEDG
jgi:hypothetical protein